MWTQARAWLAGINFRCARSKKSGAAKPVSPRSTDVIAQLPHTAESKNWNSFHFARRPSNIAQTLRRFMYIAHLIHKKPSLMKEKPVVQMFMQQIQMILQSQQM